ncbi:uncharacterized protein FTOL_00333 [Fusarium torulosum]|uniref:Uncharacterized protein n=1 Tax=Fusarium torulosum TaxID=33205 RepID=A0AAE8SCB1_9HYPO|nr:uncharacterized protein FTOL_00333 [Fusarium torulosum]
MGSKEINIKFTQEQVKKYNDQGSRLCFSAAIAGNVNISWADQYKIAATKDKFSEGVKFKISTNTAIINFAEVYTLPRDWSDGTISKGGVKDAFKFVNKTTGVASAVIYKRINGQDLPFYISTSPVDSDGNEVMTPKSVVALWFQKDAETGTMTSVNKSDVSIFDFANRSSINLKWDNCHFIEDN